jgi:pectinesterase inhibitor-like protein
MAETANVFTSSLCLLLLLLVVSVVAPVARAAEEMEMELLVPVEDDDEDLPSPSSSSCAEPVSVEAACRVASETHAGVSYDHCVASLGADPRSKAAAAEEAGGSSSSSMHGLAVLATRMAADHAASTESKMEGLSELEESPHARARYGHCLEVYGGAADLLRDALDNLRARIYGKAMEQLSAALGASESCEDAWKGHHESTAGGGIPVADHDREYGRMAHIALGFTHAAA